MGMLVSGDDCVKGKAVILAPHPDDEIIGCGGWLIKRKETGRTTVIIVASCNEDARMTECGRALEGLAAEEIITLGVEDKRNLPENGLEKAASIVSSILANEDVPSRLFVPNTADIHPLHRYTHKLALRALHDCGAHSQWSIFQYEGFTPLANPNRWLDITAEMEEKKERLGAYGSQKNKYPLAAIVESLNGYRGATLFRRGIKYAEAYRMMEIKEYLSCGLALNC